MNSRPLTVLLNMWLLAVPLLAGIKLVPDDYATIQSAIDAASAGDTVLVSSGTYYENINFNGKNITIGSLYLTTGLLNYRNTTIIDGGNAGSVVTFENSEDSTAVLSGLTLTNGENDQGGGIRCINSSPSLNTLLIIENIATIGGAGIYLKNSNPRLSAVDIIGNSSYRGAGIHFHGSGAIFDSVSRGNIHSNIGIASGQELFAYDTDSIDVFVDTLTFMYPIGTEVFPRETFNLNILHAKRNPESVFLEQVGRIYAETTDDGRTARVDSLVQYARAAGVPVIEDSTVYLFHQSASSSVLYSPWAFGPSQEMIKVGTANLFYTTVTKAMDARWEYGYDINGSFSPDPENPHISFALGAPDILSEIAMPNYVRPQEVLYDSLIAHGTLENHSIVSTNLGYTYDIEVYLPPDYHSALTKTYPSIYFNDGQLMSTNIGGPLQNVLDYMTDQGTIDGIIAVFIPAVVSAQVRETTYATDERLNYERFVVDELVSFIDETYRTIPHWAARAIGGASYGGLISTQIAYNSGKFGLVAVYSPSFWANNTIVYSSVLNGPLRNNRYYIEWGTAESQIQSDGITFKDGIIELGYDVEWNTWNEGHSNWNWRAHLDNAIEFLFPPGFLHTIHTGDTDNNGVVNELDVLSIGQYFLERGYSRHKARYSWNDDGEYNWAWESTAATYADANGDGIVNELDVIAIGVNWGNSYTPSTSSRQALPNNLDLTPDQRANFETIYKSIKGMGEPAVKMRTLLRRILDIPVPMAYQLDQNFPNPFNPTTTIRFGMPKDEIVSLSIFNLLGQTIVTPISNKAYNAGSHEIVFDASDYSSGIYFYRLSTESWSAIRKMVFIK